MIKNITAGVFGIFSLLLFPFIIVDETEQVVILQFGKPVGNPNQVLN